MYQKGLVAAVVVVLCGCAGQPTDNSPSHSTSVINAKTTIVGTFIPDSHGTQTVYTRPNMRNIRSKLEHDSFFMGWADFDKSDLFRIDQKTRYEIDHDNESYIECPISGCTNPSLLERMKSAGKKSEDDNSYQSYDERGCKMTMASNKFDVRATGNTRKFGGLDASEYTVDWKVEMKDDVGKVDMNQLRFVFWTTTPNADMQQAWKVHSQAMDKYLAARGSDPLLRLLGEDGFAALAAFTGDIKKTDPRKYNTFTRKLATIKGYPLSIKAEWFQKPGGACEVARKSSSSKSSSTDLASMAKSMVGSFLEKKRDAIVAEWDKEPRIRYIYEITAVNQQSVKDSMFEVPRGYKMEDRQ